MKTLNILVFLLVSVHGIAQQNQDIGKSTKQQIAYLNICDSSEIVLYNSEIKDTLFGKAVIRLELKKGCCNSLKVLNGKLLYLSLATGEQGDTKSLEYRYLVTTRLSDDKTKTMELYSIELYNIFKARGICYENGKKKLESNKYDFPFTFTVFPGEQ